MRKICIAAIFVVTACTSTAVTSPPTHAQPSGVSTRAYVGEPILVDQRGSVSDTKRWVGVLNSTDGWKHEQSFSMDYRRRELVYGGRMGDVVEIALREATGAAGPSTQTFRYDLSQSKSIRCQEFEFEVLRANEHEIEVRLISGSTAASALTRDGISQGGITEAPPIFVPGSGQQ